MAVLLAFLSGISFGAGDFLGGFATRRESSSATVVAWAQTAGLVPLAGAVWFFSRTAGLDDLVWGAAGGLAGAIGLILLYRGLAIGSMSVVAPIAAVGAAIVPVGFGLAAGDRPAVVALIGSAVALAGVWVVSAEGKGVPSWGAAGLPEASLAGVAFGVFFILVANTSDASGLLPLVAARLTSIPLLLLVVAGLRRSVRPARESIPATIGAGVLDITANALFLLSARAGSLPIAAVLSSLYPAATVLLAWGLLGERIDRRRAGGLGAVGVGVVLIALGGA